MRRQWKIPILMCFSGLILAFGAGAESLYELPLCKLIEEREASSERTALLEQCDKAERLITDWLESAASQGMPEQEAYDFALYYIVPGHWLKLLDLQAGDSGVCGDEICSTGETAESCPEDCGDSGDEDPGSGHGGDSGGSSGGSSGGGFPGGK